MGATCSRERCSLRFHTEIGPWQQLFPIGIHSAQDRIRFDDRQTVGNHRGAFLAKRIRERETTVYNAKLLAGKTILVQRPRLESYEHRRRSRGSKHRSACILPMTRHQYCYSRSLHAFILSSPCATEKSIASKCRIAYTLQHLSLHLNSKHSHDVHSSCSSYHTRSSSSCGCHARPAR
ncbi:hypothetical protein BDW22DRAFT_2988 [Trametopsis cervina]|nr:hypothetical protein BDW22DRAFT_2988 [Trametopsis cervina]